MHLRQVALVAAALSVAGCAGSSAARYRGGPVAPTAGASSARTVPNDASTRWAAGTERSAGAERPVVPVQFRFDVGDEIATGVWTEPELTSQQRLLVDGTISPPLLKPQRVVGLTVEEVQAKLTLAYKEYLKEPKVSVRVVTIHGDRVFVLGEVRTPQTVSLIGPITVVQSIAAAGGFAEEYAEKTRVQVLRVGPDGKPAPIFVNTKAVLAGLERDLPLQRGDIVYVPATGVAGFSRTVGQALSPITNAIGSVSSVGALIIASGGN